MCRGMMNPRELKVRHYADWIIGINDYLAAFHREKSSEKICEMEANEILLKIVRNICISQEYVQVFDCESITLKNI